jgi:hypothetical protein
VSLDVSSNGRAADLIAYWTSVPRFSDPCRMEGVSREPVRPSPRDIARARPMGRSLLLTGA